MPVPLLLTKLYIPAPGKTLVGRPRLLDKLNRGLEPGCRLTLVSAPAGFGKTTLVASWLAALKETRPEWETAWLSLDESDNDPVIFWSYVIAALQTRQPGLGQAALEALSGPGAGLERKLAPLLNDLAQGSQPLLVVLDDYHLVRSPAVHASVAFLIERAPASIHLVIASRTDPPLPLARLRGRGQMVEIRLDDLRFSDEEALAYFQARMGLDLAAPAVQALNQKTEGWIAGLQLAVLAMQENAASPAGTSRAAQFVASFSGSNRFILDYLMDEVLDRQPESIQDFLIRTSVVDQLCGPLCEALLQGSGADAQAALQHLEHSNLFLFPLDQQRYWYRYHQLFSDLLRKRLAQRGPEQTLELHRRAVRWYEENGLVPSAIQHAFAMRDLPKAAALVAQVTESLWGRGEYATLLAWMNALPDEARQPYPSLLTFQVSMLISAGKIQEAQACIPVLERYIQQAAEQDAGQAGLAGNLAALRTYIASFRRDQPALFQQARAALEALTRPEDAGQRCGVSLILGNALLTEGNLPASEAAFAGAVAAAKQAHKPSMALTGLSNQALVLWFQGLLSRAGLVCQEGLQLIEQHHFSRSPMAVDLWIIWGAVLCELGSLAEAEPFIRKGLDIAEEQQYIWQLALGWQVWARWQAAQGALEEAGATLQAALQWIEQHPVPPYFSCEIRGLLAETWVRQGQWARAGQFLQDQGIHMDSEAPFPHQAEALASGRLAVRQGDERAGAFLERLEASPLPRISLRASLLRALLASEKGQLEPGLAHLERALELAEPQRAIQAFVEEGEPMAVLLREAARQERRAHFARQLLAAFPAAPTPEKDSGGAKVAAARPAAPPGAVPLVEPLSRREQEILQLIAAGLSNKEIAQKLFLSLRTVKYYSTGLYNKLGVDSRMQAVVRARQLGLV